MTNQIQIRMLNAVYAVLLPVARLLLRSGVTYGQFDSVARRAFVREALTEHDARGRLTNTSRVAVKTGLSRKEVKRIREALGLGDWAGAGVATDHSGPPARVLHAWHADSRFTDADGTPRDLDFQDDSSGFSALVRAVAGDVPPGAVRTELKRSGAIVDLDDGRLRPVKRYYVPGNVGEKAITVMSGMVFPLTSGVAHNADPERKADGYFQRFAFSENLSPSVAAAFRSWSRGEATKFIEAMDDWLAEHEATGLDSDELSGSASTQTSGVGVFYYEGPSAEQAISETPTSKAKYPGP